MSLQVEVEQLRRCRCGPAPRHMTHRSEHGSAPVGGAVSVPTGKRETRLGFQFHGRFIF